MKDIIPLNEFLSNYSFAEVLVFVLLFFFIIKECITFIDWCKGRIKKIANKTIAEKKEKEHFEEEIEDLNKLYDDKKVVNDELSEIRITLDRMNERIETLTESDKEDIKSFITSQHHYFVYEQHWIDDHSLDCLEKRFAIYQKEHGNSFALGLMNEIRKLPKIPPQEIEHRYIKTAEYVKKSNE